MNNNLKWGFWCIDGVTGKYSKFHLFSDNQDKKTICGKWATPQILATVSFVEDDDYLLQTKSCKQCKKVCLTLETPNA